MPRLPDPLIDDMRRRGRTTDVPTAARLLGIGRTLGMRLARERGELTPGVPVLRVGRLLKVPVMPLLVVLGYADVTRDEDE
jgi:hypothetical protein